MAVCVTCNLCRDPGTLAGAQETERVPSNVRRFQENLFTVWRCTNCLSLHCAEDADLPRYYADYPLQRQKFTFHDKIGYRNRLRLLRERGLKATDRVLDYGCGIGLFVEYLRRQGVDAFGYDAFVPAFADAKALEESYDVVTSYDVIEHDDDTRAFLQRQARLVRPGGLLVVGTPRADAIVVTRHTDPQLHQPYHRHILSEQALVTLGLDTGLELVDVYRRSYYDSLVPTVNWRFLTGNLQAAGGFLDVAVEPPQMGPLLRSPKLVAMAFAGYFFPPRNTMIVTFRRPANMPAADRR